VFGVDLCLIGPRKPLLRATVDQYRSSRVGTDTQARQMGAWRAT